MINVAGLVVPEQTQSAAESRVAGFACVSCHAAGAEADGGRPRVPDGATDSDAAELPLTGRRADRLELIASAALALEKAAGALSREALVEEWYSLDIKDGIDLYQEVRRFETYLIKRALREAGGSQSKAARLLGLNTTTLHEKIKRYEIDYTKAARPPGRGIDQPR
jgi:DNA-binding protein Fis